MKLNEYQLFTKTTALFEKKTGLWYTALGIAGESGEYCDKIKKVIRDNSGVLLDNVRVALAKELGDILWYVAQAADVIGYTLEEIAQMNVDKLTSRKERGKVRGSGDDR